MRAAEDREDRRWMRQALRLAARGEGWTRPNPPVGALIVKRGGVVGKGWHRQAGGPHAEVFALEQAGDAARGATLYVTLEPCSTWGRTPPCTSALIRAGIRRVVAGAADPNPAHARRGFVALQNAGVDVQSGILETDCQALIAPFRTHILTGRPYVTLKLALTLDGRIADRTGRSRWITGESARKWVQRLRRRADAVLVGAGTVCADNPSLLPTGSNPNPVYRVIVDGTGRVPPAARVVSDSRAGQTIMVTTRSCPASVARAWQRHGARVWRLPAENRELNLTELLARLGGMGVMHVACEGGGHLAAGLVRAGVVDDYALFYAPRLFGGAAVPGLGGSGWLLAGAPRLRIESVRRFGEDILVRAVPHSHGEGACSPG